jgi:hypothetical protein
MVLARHHAVEAATQRHGGLGAQLSHNLYRIEVVVGVQPERD